MKPIPHNHSCPACACDWDCMNQHCTDLEAKWCDNHCRECKDPPPQIARLRALQAAGHELHHAAFLLERYGQHPQFAAQVETLRKQILEAIPELAKGEAMDGEPLSDGDLAEPFPERGDLRDPTA